MIELNKMAAIEAKLDVIMNKLNNKERRNHSAHEVGIVEDDEKKNEEGLDHEGPCNMEKAQYIQGNRSYNLNPNNNLLTHYTLALETMRTYLMEVECNRVKEKCRTFSRIMLMRVSRTTTSGHP